MLSDELCVDETRIYLGGASLGTSRAAALAGRLWDRLAGVSLVIGGGLPPTEDAVPVPMIAGTGRDDAYAVGVMAEGWAAHNGCDAAPTREAPAAGVTVTRWQGCSDGADVELWVLEEMGHQIPMPDCGAVPPKYQSVCYESEYGGWRATRSFLERHTRTT